MSQTPKVDALEIICETFTRNAELRKHLQKLRPAEKDFERAIFLARQLEKQCRRLATALLNERALRLLGQQPEMHWESLRDLRRSTYADTDAALLATGTDVDLVKDE